jgi:multidrug efflux pump
VIVASDGYQSLSRVVRTIQDAPAKNPGFLQVDPDPRLNKCEIQLDVDRERTADMGVSADAIARTVETLLGGRSVTRFKRNGEQYDVVVQTESGQRSAPEDIDRLFARGRPGARIPLASLVTTRVVVVPRELNHFAQCRSATITANLAPELSLGQALDFMDAAARGILPEGCTTVKVASSAARRARWRSYLCFPCCSSAWCWQLSSSASWTR